MVAKMPVLRVLLALVIVGGALVSAGYGASSLYQRLYAVRIVPGVHGYRPLGDIALGGQEPEAARTTLVRQYNRYLGSATRLRHGGHEWQSTPRDLGLRVNFDTTIEAARAFGRAPLFLDRFLQPRVLPAP